MVTPIKGNLTARQIAEKEVAEEQNKKDVKRYKELLRQKADAEKVVRNIELELEELDYELNQD